MSSHCARIVLLTAVGLLAYAPSPAQITWELVWADEFDGTTVDPSKWSFQIGDGCDIPDLCGWGNNELQYYREENASVSGGRLVITAREEPFAGYAYTSARMRTINKGDWLYGRFEIRAKLPEGKGLWPAIWMLPTETAYGVWAASGEIDIMEMLGRIPNEILGTIYYGHPAPDVVATSASFTLPAGDFASAFHDFALEWDPWELRWYVDGELFRSERTWFSESAQYPAPFNREFHLLLNVAVGGHLDGPPDATTRFPQTMEVEYVRVYRATGVKPGADLDAPLPGQVLAPAATLTLEATATDPDGVVGQVDFYQDDGLLGTARTAPYTIDVDDLAAGCYSVYAVATDDLGWQTSSDTVSVRVGDACPQRTPYLMAAADIPGVVEAEFFDTGGEDVAYNDLDAGNLGNAPIRESDNVDLSWAGADVGYSVVRTNRTEWVEYTVNVATDGLYDVIARVGSSAPSASFSLSFDGIDKTGRITVPTTGGETQWTNLVLPGISLDAGLQTMRLILNSGGLGISRFIFRPSSSTGVDIEGAASGLRLLDPYPNPAADAASVEYSLPRTMSVSLRVFDLLGREVTVLDEGLVPQGRGVAILDTGTLPTGVYVIRLSGDGIWRSRPVIVAR